MSRDEKDTRLVRNRYFKLFKKTLMAVYSKKIIISILSIVGVIILFLSLIVGNYIVITFSFLFFIIAILEERVNSLVVFAISRAIVTVIYCALITGLITCIGYYLYTSIYEPYQQRLRHHYEYISGKELSKAMNKMSESELKAIVCRGVAEDLLWWVSYHRNITDGIQIPDYSSYTDEEMHVALNQLSQEESQQGLSEMKPNDVNNMQSCLKWKVGGW